MGLEESCHAQWLSQVFFREGWPQVMHARRSAVKGAHRRLGRVLQCICVCVCVASLLCFCLSTHACCRFALMRRRFLTGSATGSHASPVDAASAIMRAALRGGGCNNKGANSGIGYACCGGGRARRSNGKCCIYQLGAHWTDGTTGLPVFF